MMAQDPSHNGFSDIFVTKLTTDLSTIIASTFLGGTENDQLYQIATDSNNNIFTVGISFGAGYATTVGAYDQTGNGQNDLVISKLSNNLATLSASTYIGTTANEQNPAIAIDSNDNVFVFGATYSISYPIAGPVFDTVGDTLGDGIISKFSNDLTTLTASTYLGSGGMDFADGETAIAIDANDNIYVVGQTTSANYPTTLGAYDTSYAGGTDSVITKINNNLTSILASSFIGGIEFDLVTNIHIDGTDVLIVGGTDSADYPTTAGAYETSINGSTFKGIVSVFDTNLSALNQSTFIGGSSQNNLFDITTNTQGQIIIG